MARKAKALEMDEFEIVAEPAPEAAPEPVAEPVVEAAPEVAPEAPPVEEPKVELPPQVMSAQTLLEMEAGRRALAERARAGR